jgi:tripartite-type tricarboxylate transporter receptor subunit TctC
MISWWRRLRGWLALGGVLAAALPLPASAQSVDDFYRGKRIRLIVGSDAGGAYDAFARALVRHWSGYIPGHPGFVVENMPGGGGLLSANYLYNIAPRDGLVLGMVERGSAMDPIVHGDVGRARFDPRKFNWLGSPTQETGLMVVRQPSPIKTVEDLKQEALIVSSTTHTAPTSVYPRVLDRLFGMKFRVIEGYKSSREALLAVDRGEVEGHVSGASSGILRAQIEPWIRAGKVKIIMQLGLSRDPAYPDAALVTDLARTPRERDILALMFAQQVMAYPLVAPPGSPADRVEALRNAFDATVKDADFLADARGQNLQLRPVAGSAIEDLLARAYATPPDILASLAALDRDQ